jgi:hypothetical protein
VGVAIERAVARQRARTAAPLLEKDPAVWSTGSSGRSRGSSSASWTACKAGLKIPAGATLACAWNSGPVLQRRAEHRRRWSEQALPYFVSSTRRVA